MDERDHANVSTDAFKAVRLLLDVARANFACEDIDSYGYAAERELLAFARQLEADRA